jgi:prepilin-type N-terminal cleavage/methylation domain-containing protein
VTRSPRRGVSLPELLVSLVMFALIAGTIVKVLSTGQRAYDTQVQHVDLQQNVRIASMLLPGELRELDASDGDIITMDSVSISMRSLRQMGVICTLPALGGSLTAVTFAVRDTLMSIRYFAPGDSLLLYYEGDPTIRTDDGWMPGVLTSVGANTACTDGSGKTGMLFTVALRLDASASPGQTNTAGFIPLAAPIRAFRVITYKRYFASDGNWYVGMDSAGTTLPLIGPLADSLGLKFSYYDSLTPPTRLANTAQRSVARINIALALKTARAIRKNIGAPSADTGRMTLDVALRNNRRF